MIDDLTGALESSERDFYLIIWMDHFLKRIKIFLRELSHKAINTANRLQHRMPYMPLSPSWCIMCCANVESPAHLFIHCPFARQFWDLILEAFGWSTTFSNDILDILNSLMVGVTRLLVARRLFSWLFFGLSFGLYGASLIGVFLIF